MLTCFSSAFSVLQVAGMFPSRGSNTYGQQPYAAQSGYGQNVSVNLLLI